MTVARHRHNNDGKLNFRGNLRPKHQLSAKNGDVTVDLVT